MAALIEPFAGCEATQVARQLIDRFGSLPRALSASEEQLVRATPDRAMLLRQLRAARTLAESTARESLARGKVKPQEAKFLQYLRVIFAGRTTEALHVTYVNGRAGYLADEFLGRGCPSSVNLNVRSLVERALELGARGVVLAHNHPSGCCDPSGEDIAATRQLALLIRALDICLIDHLIIGSNAITSMRLRGTLG